MSSSFDLFQTLLICENIFNSKKIILPRNIIEIIKVYSTPQKWLEYRKLGFYQELIEQKDENLTRFVESLKDMLLLNHSLKNRTCPLLTELNRALIFAKKPIVIYTHKEESMDKRLIGFEAYDNIDSKKEAHEIFLKIIQKEISSSIGKKIRHLLDGVWLDRDMRNLNMFALQEKHRSTFTTEHWNKLKEFFHNIIRELGYNTIERRLEDYGLHI